MTLTIARRLWLGFGTVVLVMLAAGALILLSVRVMNGTLEEALESGRNPGGVTHEMELRASEYGRSVDDYLVGAPDASSDRESLAQARTQAARSFERSRSDFEDQSGSARLSERVADLSNEYLESGGSLVSLADAQSSLGEDFGATTDSMSGVLEGNDSALGDVEDQQARRSLLAANADLGEASGYLQSYLRARDPQDRERVLTKLEDLGGELQSLGERDLGREQTAAVEDLEGSLADLEDLAGEIGSSSERIEEEAARFESAGDDLDALLEGEARSDAASQREAVASSAREESGRILWTVIAMLGLTLLASAVAATLIGRSILGSIARLEDD